MELSFGLSLEEARKESLLSLGTLCFNMYVNSDVPFPQLGGAVLAVKSESQKLTQLRSINAPLEQLHLQNTAIEEKLTELGCVCYSLYIDNKPLNPELLPHCEEIRKATQEIANSASTDAADSAAASPEEEATVDKAAFDAVAETAPAAPAKVESTASIPAVTLPQAEPAPIPEAPVSSPEAVTPDSFGEPVGMEAVPYNYKLCFCSYKNRPDAFYCAKCGTRLED